MTPKQLLEHYGGSNLAIALALGYTEPAVRYWIDKNKIPYRAQQLIEAKTDGKLIARKDVKKPKSKVTSDVNPV